MIETDQPICGNPCPGDPKLWCEKRLDRAGRHSGRHRARSQEGVFVQWDDIEPSTQYPYEIVRGPITNQEERP